MVSKEDITTFCKKELSGWESAYKREFQHPPFEQIDTSFISGMISAYEAILEYIEDEK